MRIGLDPLKTLRSSSPRMICILLLFAIPVLLPFENCAAFAGSD